MQGSPYDSNITNHNINQSPTLEKVPLPQPQLFPPQTRQYVNIPPGYTQSFGPQFPNSTPIQQGVLNIQAEPQIKVEVDTVNQWGSDPVKTICPRCNISIKTKIVNKKYNPCAVSLCFWCGIWFCIQACRGKPFGCYDAIHICPRCNSILSKYEAC